MLSDETLRVYAKLRNLDIEYCVFDEDDENYNRLQARFLGDIQRDADDDAVFVKSRRFIASAEHSARSMNNYRAILVDSSDKIWRAEIDYWASSGGFNSCSNITDRGSCLDEIEKRVWRAQKTNSKDSVWSFICTALVLSNDRIYSFQVCE